MGVRTQPKSERRSLFTPIRHHARTPTRCDTSKVRLEVSVRSYFSEKLPNFNTSKVRLEVGMGLQIGVKTKKFQYLEGAIRGPLPSGKSIGRSNFNTSKVRLEADRGLTGAQPSVSDFNTSKVRLEDVSFTACSREKGNFNTSKVRLEGGRPVRSLRTRPYFNTSKVRLEVLRLQRGGDDVGEFQYLEGAIRGRKRL